MSEKPPISPDESNINRYSLLNKAFDVSVSARSGLSLATATRQRRIYIGLALGILTLLSSAFFVFFYQKGNVAPSQLGWMYSMHHVTVLVSFTLIYILLRRQFIGTQIRPLRQLTILAGTGWALLIFHLLVFENVGDYYMSSGMPSNSRTLTKVNLMSLGYAFFAITLLLSYRSLVLFQRTIRSRNTWNAMMGFIALTSFSALFTDPHEDITIITLGLLVIAVVLMVANSFRLSWIIGTSIKQKLKISFVNIMLLSLLTVLLAVDNFGIKPSSDFVYGRIYSYPLNLFVLQTFLFGIIYSMTVFLSLFFHMPTSQAFKKKEGQFEAIANLSALTNEVFDLNKLTSTITSSPIKGGMADSSWLTLVNTSSGSLKQSIVASEGIDSHDINNRIDVKEACSMTYNAKGPLYVEDAAVHSLVKSSVNDKIGSFLAVPLIARGQILGTLFLSKSVNQGFEEDERASIKTFTDQAAMALDNARLFEEELEKERLVRELAIAREMQQKLLPRTIPKDDHFQLAVSSISAHEVGGDYYDFSQIDEDKWAFIVGDVSGKGTSAAFYMAEVKGIFQVLCSLAPTASSFLEYANNALHRSMEKTAFISVVYGIIDTKEGTFELARAGHCPILHAKKDGKTEYIRTVGMGLGLDEGKIFAKTLESKKTEMDEGDLFILYSDGVVESRNESDEEFGYERLQECVSKNTHLSADDLHRKVIDDLNEFIGGANYDDDLTLMVIKWKA